MTISATMPINRSEKGWGYEIWIHNSPVYCGKILVLEAGKKCSLHFHRLKRETFYIQSGRLWIRTVEEDGTESRFEMKPGDVLEIPQGLQHQFGGIAPVTEIVEISTQHFESDSYRVELGD